MLTQKEASNLMGVSDSSWSQWENGKRIPNESNRTMIAEVLELSVDQIWRPGEEIYYNT